MDYMVEFKNVSCGCVYILFMLIQRLFHPNSLSLPSSGSKGGSWKCRLLDIRSRLSFLPDDFQ